MPDDPVQHYPAFLLVGFNCNMHYFWCDVTNMHDCWPRVSINGMYAGSVAVQSNMPPSPLEIKKKSYLTDAPPSNMPANTVKLYQPRLLH